MKKFFPVFCIFLFWFASPAISQFSPPQNGGAGITATPEIICRYECENRTWDVGGEQVLIECQENEGGVCVPSGEGYQAYLDFNAQKRRESGLIGFGMLIALLLAPLIQIGLNLYILKKYSLGGNRKFFKFKLVLAFLIPFFVFISFNYLSLLPVLFILLLIQPILTIYLYLKTANELQKRKLLLPIIFLSEIIFIVPLAIFLSQLLINATA